MMATQAKAWALAEVSALYHQPFNDLMLQAQTLHREHFPANQVQISTLLSIKTGACPEDCKYCSQSGHYKTGLEKEKLMSCEKVCEAADKAKQNGATRFCMGAAWRNPPEHAMPALIDMIQSVKSRGLETCLTAGMLSAEQAKTLKEAGLDYYNHNLDTSREYYPEVITSRNFDDRLDTIKNVRDAGISVCCGGILNLGESLEDRFKLLMELAHLDPYPESVPINMLVPIPGTPLAKQQQIGGIEFARMIAVARIMMPKAYVRLSAGRNNMSDELQAMCFFAGANSIHYGEKLLTTDLPGMDKDQALFENLGVTTCA
jgi:biotin synthase